MPTYNARRWLGDAIDSALAQTYPNCEVLVIDDGSTDGTGEWLAKEYGGRIRYLYKENGGLSSARNLGLHHAQGEYIQFLDADDLILPEKVAVHAAYLDVHPEVDVVYGHCLMFHDVRERLYDWPAQPRYRSGQVFASMIDGGYLLPHMPLSRRACLERVGGFDESLTSCVDWDYWLRVAWSGVTFFYLQGPAMALYRVRSNSMSGAHVNHACNGLHVLAKVATYVQDLEEQQRLGLRRAQGHWRFRYGKALAENGQLRQGLRQMARGILADRRDLDYKLSFFILCLTAGPRRAPHIVNWLKDRREDLQRWRPKALKAS
jgi:glycosyltransferase involved in cell wall biosynthesis